MFGIQEAEVRMYVGDYCGGAKEPVIVMCNVPVRITLMCCLGDSIL